MKTDDDQTATDFQRLHCRFKPGFQIAQFVVDVNTQALKGTRCRILAFFPSRVGDLEDFSQIGSALERLDFTALNDGIGHALGETLLAVFLEHAGDFFGGRAGNELGSADAAGRVHAHIQRAVIHETETALWVVELRRRYAQVQQNAADLARQAKLLSLRAQLGKAALHNDKAAVFGR